MLEVIIPEQHYEFFDEEKEEFLPPIDIPQTKIQLEHSLISLKKWEQKWHKPFIENKEKTHEELADYIRCMTLTHGVNPEVYNWIPQNVIDQVVNYIEDPMTATRINDNLIGAQKSSSEIVTAEIIYYWMISLSIPIEFQKWHLSQLLTLIRVVNIKNSPPIKKDPQVAAKERAALNKLRRQRYNSKG